MKKMTISSLIFTAILFCSYNFTVLSETREFNTVTEALNYNGDRDAVIKLVITGTITGTDFSPGVTGMSSAHLMKPFLIWKRWRF